MPTFSQPSSMVFLVKSESMPTAPRWWLLPASYVKRMGAYDLVSVRILGYQ